MTGCSPSGAIPSKSMFSSTLAWPKVAETRTRIRKKPITLVLRLTGTSTAASKTLSGGCFGFRKSRISVRFGTMNIVKMYTTTIPPERAIPTVLIGAIGVKMREMNPMTVVTADKNTALPVDCMEACIFSLRLPSSSA